MHVSARDHISSTGSNLVLYVVLAALKICCRCIRQLGCTCFTGSINPPVRLQPQVMTSTLFRSFMVIQSCWRCLWYPLLSCISVIMGQSVHHTDCQNILVPALRFVWSHKLWCSDRCHCRYMCVVPITHVVITRFVAQHQHFRAQLAVAATAAVVTTVIVS